MTDNRLFIFGFGYTAHFVANDLRALNFSFSGTSRHQKCADELSNRYTYVDFSRKAVDAHLQNATHVLVSTPPSPDTGDPVLAQFQDLLKQYASQIQWIGYLSSTGVYGDHQGQWVDELSESVNPGKQGALRLQTENAWLSFAKETALPLHIFRLAGIYGPYRNALTRLKSGKSQTIHKEGQYFSRIHVEDIAKIILASIQNPHPFSIYNVADDEPSSTQDVDEFAAKLLNVAPPTLISFQDAVLSSMAKEFYNHNRRVSNQKIKQELAVKLNYPDYREGLLHLYETKDY